MIKVFLTVGFVMSLVLVSCDANIVSSNSDEEELKPINIVGTYESEDKTYYVRVTKDDTDSSGYLLKFIDTGNIDELEKPDDGYKYDSEKTSFTFYIMRGRDSIDYVLLFEEEGFPMLTVDGGEPIKLSPYNKESL